MDREKLREEFEEIIGCKTGSILYTKEFIQHEGDNEIDTKNLWNWINKNFIPEGNANDQWGKWEFCPQKKYWLDNTMPIGYY